MSASLPTIRSFSNLIHEGELIYVWGEPGSGRDKLIVRIVEDLGGRADAVIPKNAFTALYQALPGVTAERSDLLSWSDVLSWVHLSVGNLLIIPSPPSVSIQDLRTILPMVASLVARLGKILVVVADVPERYRRETQLNPTEHLDLDPASMRNASCVIHFNEVMWPGAVHIAKNRYGDTGIYFL